MKLADVYVVERLTFMALESNAENFSEGGCDRLRVCFLLIEKDLYRSWLQDAIQSGPYKLLATTKTLVDCSPRSQILIYAYRPD